MPRHGRQPGPERGQIIVVAALAMIAIIGGVSLVLEGGNAYAHQRVAQNGVDAIANAGATVLAERLGGASRTDGDVAAAMDAMKTANALADQRAFYTNVTGELLNPAGVARPARPQRRRWATGRSRRARRASGPRATCTSTPPSPGCWASTSSRPRPTRRP